MLTSLAINMFWKISGALGHRLWCSSSGTCYAQCYVEVGHGVKVIRSHKAELRNLA